MHNNFKQGLDKMESKLTATKEVDYHTITENPEYIYKQKNELKLRFAVSTSVKQEEKNALKQLTQGSHWIILIYDVWPMNTSYSAIIDKFHLGIYGNSKIKIVVERTSLSKLRHYEIYKNEYQIKYRSYLELIQFAKDYHSQNSTYLLFADNCRKFCMDLASFCGVSSSEIDYIKIGRAFYMGVNQIKGNIKITRDVSKSAGLLAIKTMKSGVKVVDIIHDKVHDLHQRHNSSHDQYFTEYDVDIERKEENLYWNDEQQEENEEQVEQESVVEANVFEANVFDDNFDEIIAQTEVITVQPQQSIANVNESLIIEEDFLGL